MTKNSTVNIFWIRTYMPGTETENLEQLVTWKWDAL